MIDFIQNIEYYIQNANNEYAKKALKLLKENNISFDVLTKHIENMSIFLDFDEVIVDLITPWLEYMEAKQIINPETGVAFVRKDIDTFTKFNDIGPESMKFLNDFFLYHSLEEAQKIDPTYTRLFSEVKLKSDAIRFFDILKENGLLTNIKILTASASKTSWSKNEFVQKHLSKYIEPFKQIITTGDKGIINDIKKFAILVDDGEHNHIGTTAQNDFITTFLINDYHNQTLKTSEDGAGKRIFRINTLDENDFFFKLMFSAVQDIVKKKDKSINGEIIQETYLQEYIQQEKDKIIDLKIKEELEKQRKKVIEKTIEVVGVRKVKEIFTDDSDRKLIKEITQDIRNRKKEEKVELKNNKHTLYSINT